jgi:hypothetical protein
MRKHSLLVQYRHRRRNRRPSIHPIPVLCLKRLTGRARLQYQAQLLQRQAPCQVLRLRRLRMNSPRSRLRDLRKRPAQKHARSITTEAASRELHGLIIAALHLVFVSLLMSHPRSTGRRSFGGPAFMITQTAILRVGVPGMGDIRGVPGITGTKGSPLSIGLRGHLSAGGSSRQIARGAHRIG